MDINKFSEPGRRELFLLSDRNTQACPIPQFVEAAKIIPYGTPDRGIFEMLFLGGPRQSEIGRMFTHNLIGDLLKWKMGKNQTGHRKIFLPDGYMRELAHMRREHRCYDDKLFPMDGESFARRFNKIYRSKLGDAWHVKVPNTLNPRVPFDYALSLKSLRKTCMTLFFARELARWGDPRTALEFVSKEWGHASMNMTVMHYLMDFDMLDIPNLPSLDPAFYLERIDLPLEKIFVCPELETQASKEIKQRLMRFLPQRIPGDVKRNTARLVDAVAYTSRI